MNCPTCNSDNTQKLNVIYESDTHDIEMSSVTSGTAYSTSGHISFGSARTKGTGTQQSRMAAKVAPPAKASYKTTIVTSLIAFGLIYLGLPNRSGTYFLIMIVLILIGAFFGYRAFRYNSGEWIKKYEVWQKSWHCNKCGDIYMQ